MRRSSGPPAWLIFLVVIAFVFAGYYLWTGAQSFMRAGGLGVVEATARADVIATATADRVLNAVRNTPVPTLTPIPDCQLFVVSVPSAIVREAPNTNAAIVASWDRGTEVCVLTHDGEWYTIDSNPRTRRIEFAYMHESIISAVEPTATPTITASPPPTVTDVPTLTPSLTFTPRPTETIDPDATATFTPTPTITPPITPTPTSGVQRVRAAGGRGTG